MPTPKEDFQSKIDANNNRIAIENKLMGKLKEEVSRLTIVIDTLKADNEAYTIAIAKLDELTQPQPEASQDNL